MVYIYIYPWPIYTMAMLVITRWYFIALPRPIIRRNSPLQLQSSALQRFLAAARRLQALPVFWRWRSTNKPRDLSQKVKICRDKN